MTTDSKDAPAAPPVEVLTGLPDGRRIARALQRGAARLVVLTPDPDHARSLRHRFRASDRVEIVEAALAATGGQAEWLRFNEPGLGAFRAATPHARKLFPGLDIRARLTVSRMSCDDLAGHLGTQAGPLHLEIDTPGEEAAIIAALASSDLRSELREIRLRAARQPLVEGGAGLGALFAALRQDGYQVTMRDDRDPDRPWLHFVPDLIQRDLRRKLAAAAAEARKAVQADIERVTDQLAAAERMQDLLRADLAELRARYQVAEAARAAQADLLARLLASLEDAASSAAATGARTP
ncbi:hypothetical protein [Paracoccus spongiarum]|uniref:Uncharacterized protein n=1 Tax=Paracoccus spongiarum TaxID=3064387 RepID=A0ABT9JCJ9_9RHOB|nr:hypothetical protein [Paracoccus sp. 2205BS29-5]MDP5307538.1 hypothetical protein [Paracoccus sp. 2205BS29-5]